MSVSDSWGRKKMGGLFGEQFENMFCISNVIFLGLLIPFPNLPQEIN